jgi:hypothetical protein
MDALAHEFGKLADCLSEDHDLALLKRSAVDQIETLGQREEIDRLVLIIDQRREQLQAKASNLGARVFAEKPRRFADRLEVYWEAWRPTEVEPVKAEQLTLAAYAGAVNE